MLCVTLLRCDAWIERGQLQTNTDPSWSVIIKGRWSGTSCFKHLFLFTLSAHHPSPQLLSSKENNKNKTECSDTNERKWERKFQLKHNPLTAECCAHKTQGRWCLAHPLVLHLFHTDITVLMYFALSVNLEDWLKDGWIGAKSGIKNRQHVNLRESTSAVPTHLLSFSFYPKHIPTLKQAPLWTGFSRFSPWEVMQEWTPLIKQGP